MKSVLERLRYLREDRVPAMLVFPPGETEVPTQSICKDDLIIWAVNYTVLHGSMYQCLTVWVRVRVTRCCVSKESIVQTTIWSQDVKKSTFVCVCECVSVCVCACVCVCVMYFNLCHYSSGSVCFLSQEHWRYRRILFLIEPDRIQSYSLFERR